MPKGGYQYQAIIEYIRQQIGRGEFVPGQRMPTQQELSQRFGVSRSTVVKALALLNADGTLSSPMGKGLAVSGVVGRTEVALLLARLDNLTIDFLSTFQPTLAEHGISVRIYYTYFDGTLYGSEEAVLRQLAADSSVRAVVLSPRVRRKHPDDFYGPLLAQLNKPVMLFNRRIPERDLSFVEYDYYAGGRMLGEHLAGRGYRRLAYVPTRAIEYGEEHRFKGLQDAYQRSGHAHDIQLLPGLLDSIAMRRIRTLLKQRQIDCIVGGMDYLTARVFEGIRDLNLRIPEEVALAGFDNNFHSHFTQPPLTTVQPPTKEAGRVVAQSVVAMLEDMTHRVQVSLPGELVVRGSTVSEMGRTVWSQAAAMVEHV